MTTTRFAAKSFPRYFTGFVDASARRWTAEFQNGRWDWSICWEKRWARSKQQQISLSSVIPNAKVVRVKNSTRAPKGQLLLTHFRYFLRICCDASRNSSNCQANSPFAEWALRFDGKRDGKQNVTKKPKKNELEFVAFDSSAGCVSGKSDCSSQKLYFF